MGKNPNRRVSKAGGPLTIRAIVIGGILMAVVGAVAVSALLYFYGGGTDRDRAGLDVVRTAGALVVGIGGAIALLLTARRQRSIELTLEHQREDAAEQRITELYTRAVDQLGSERAPVRLGGLHALERLAQNNPGQRQTIVDVICAYLRMPYTAPEVEPPADDASVEVHNRYEQRLQESQVRLTAQRILSAHLRPATMAIFWRDIDLDLTEAHLHGIDLSGCRIRTCRFGGARFTGDATFVGVQFDGDAIFDRAQFAGEVFFAGARFAADAGFDEVSFAGDTGFREAQFGGRAGFDEVKFAGLALFHGAQFAGNARFNRVQFIAQVGFDKVEFAGDAWFSQTQFGGPADFAFAKFAKPVEFDDVKFTRDAVFSGAQFAGDAFFHRTQFAGRAWFDRVTFARDAGFSWAQFGGAAEFGKAQFASGTQFSGARARPGKEPVSSWPAGWALREARVAEGEEEGWSYLVPDDDSVE